MYTLINPSIWGTNITNTLKGASHGEGHSFPLENRGFKRPLTVSFKEGNLKKIPLVLAWEPTIDILFITTDLTIFFFWCRRQLCLAHRFNFYFLFFYYVLQVFDVCPLKGWFFVLETHLSNNSDRFEYINDVVQSPDLSFDQGWVISVNEYFGGLLKWDRPIGKDKDLEEASSQIFKWFFLLRGIILEFVAILSDQVYGMDSFGKPPPNIIILGCFFDNT